jgi:hypothetical protein
MSQSIFSAAVRARTPSTTNPRGDDPRSPPKSNALRSAAPALDSALIAILEEPLLPGETAFAGFARKELALRNTFAQLTVMQSRALHARLANPRSGDQLVRAFMRLTADRRGRLISFLADARRREARKGG